MYVAFRYTQAFFKVFWPSLIVLAVILYATLTPDPLDGEPLPTIPHIDKVIHFLMMGGLNAAILFDLRRQNLSSNRPIALSATENPDKASSAASASTSDKTPARHRRLTIYIILYTAIGVVLFSAFDEWLQGTLAIGRPSDPFDALANLMGILTSALLAPPVLRKLFPNK